MSSSISPLPKRNIDLGEPRMTVVIEAKAEITQCIAIRELVHALPSEAKFAFTYQLLDAMLNPILNVPIPFHDPAFRPLT